MELDKKSNEADTLKHQLDATRREKEAEQARVAELEAQLALAMNKPQGCKCIIS